MAAATGRWTATVRRASRGEELVGLEYDGPVRRPARAGGCRPPRDPVGRGRARRGHRHRPHRARAPAPRTSSSRACTTCPCSRRSTSPAASCRATAPFEGLATDEAAEPIVEALRERGDRSSRPARSSTATRSAGAARRRSSSASSTTGSSPATRSAQPLLDANDEVAWTPPNYKKRMDDWLRNMGDWNISRKRYFGLPLPFYPCACGELNVIGSRAELEERATGGLEQLQELHRPWIDEVPIRCESCNEEVRRDARRSATPGSTPASSRSRRSAGRTRSGSRTATGRARPQGLTGADLPDHAYWEQWFPADWISEMREQIRLWFYSIVVHGDDADGPAAVPRGADLREACTTRPAARCTSRRGNAIEANEALRADGRRRRCAGSSARRTRARTSTSATGPADEVKRRLLTLWNSVGFLVTYANIAGWQPKWGTEPSSRAALDRWLVARTAQLVAEGEAAYERYSTPAVTRAFESYVEDLSNWYIRRSRRRFWDGEPEALETLWWSLVQALRVVAPVMPFLTDHLWRALVPCDGARTRSTSPAGPRPRRRTTALLDEMAAVRRVVELGRQARAQSGHQAPPAAAPARRPGRRRRLGATPSEIAEELSVKEVEFGPVEATELRVKPNLPVLGPEARQGARRRARRARGRRVRGARRRPLPRRRLRALARRGARRAARQGGLGGRRRGRPHRRARPRPRPGARARRPRPRADPRGQHAAQGAGARDHRPDRPDAAPPSSPRTRTGSRARRSPSASSTATSCRSRRSSR